MKIKNILVTLILVTLILTACSASATLEPEAGFENQIRENGVLSPVTATPVPEETSKTNSETNPDQSETTKGIDISDGRVIVYQREGGLAGRSEEWIIYADGTIVDHKGKETQVDPRLIEAIVNMADFTSLQDSYATLNNCCDLFTYTVTIIVNGEAKSITTVDGAKQPRELTSLMNELGQLLAAAQ